MSASGHERTHSPQSGECCRDAGTPLHREMFSLCGGFSDEMDDPHQVMTIIATAICDARNAADGRPLDPEEAKQIAKCICEALSDAGLQIVDRRPR
jgi:hypothetical protein